MAQGFFHGDFGPENGGCPVRVYCIVDACEYEGDLVWVVSCILLWLLVVTLDLEISMALAWIYSRRSQPGPGPILPVIYISIMIDTCEVFVAYWDITIFHIFRLGYNMGINTDGPDGCTRFDSWLSGKVFLELKAHWHVKVLIGRLWCAADQLSKSAVCCKGRK